MTDRRRGRPRTGIKAAVVGVLFAFLSSSAAASHLTFSAQQQIDTAADRPAAVHTADIDGDGDVDVVAALEDSDSVAWYENTDGDGSAWTSHTIATSFNTPQAVYAVDVDGDTDVDVVSGAIFEDIIVWFENTAGDGSAWAQRTVGTNRGPFGLVPVDMEGDGDMDIVAGDQIDNEVEWWENTAGDGTAWSRRTVGGLARPLDVAVTDVDGDSDLDVLAIRANSAGGIFWFENTAGDASAWTTRAVDGSFASPTSVAGADLDGDGDGDVVGGRSSGGIGGEVAWWENTDGDGTAWTKVSLDGSFGFPVLVRTVDLDADGDVDILASGENAKEIAWWENAAGDGSVWTRHSIDKGLSWADTFPDDLDGDGDLDVVGVATDDVIAWWEQEASCGNGAVEAGEACDDGNAVGGDCCSSSCTFETVGSACGDATDDACTEPDSCDGAGACLSNHVGAGAPCGDQGVECAVNDACDGAGACVDNGFEAAGSACGDATNEACTEPDSCDGAGTCLSNHVGAGAPCGDQGVECTINDACDGAGACVDNGFEAIGSACGDATDDACTDPDSCDGAGTCLSNHAGAGAPCGDQGVECAVNDACDGAGGCVDNGFENASTVCRSAAGSCDIAENCTGASAGCPPDAFASAGTVCRASADPQCDLPELCNGAGASCPADLFEPDGLVCDDSDPATVGETCTGGACGCIGPDLDGDTISDNCDPEDAEIDVAKVVAWPTRSKLGRVQARGTLRTGVFGPADELDLSEGVTVTVFDGLDMLLSRSLLASHCRILPSGSVRCKDGRRARAHFTPIQGDPGMFKYRVSLQKLDFGKPLLGPLTVVITQEADLVDRVGSNGTCKETNASLACR